MPIFPIIARVLLYLGSVLFGAAATRITTGFLDKKREREWAQRREALKEAQRKEFSKDR